MVTQPGHLTHLVYKVFYSGLSFFYTLSLSSRVKLLQKVFPHQVQTNLSCKVLSTKSLRPNMWGLVRKIVVWLMHVHNPDNKKKRREK